MRGRTTNHIRTVLNGNQRKLCADNYFFFSFNFSRMYCVLKYQIETVSDIETREISIKSHARARWEFRKNYLKCIGSKNASEIRFSSTANATSSTTYYCEYRPTCAETLKSDRRACAYTVQLQVKCRSPGPEKRVGRKSAKRDRYVRACCVAVHAFSHVWRKKMY